MAKLKYTFKTDTLFKMLFVRHRDLLRQLVATLLDIRFESIERLEITNSEMSPEVIGGKFCRLDINMEVDGQLVNLEIQVRDEGDYPERALFHWSRMYSSALPAGEDYLKLPRTVVISIVDFNLFDSTEFHSEFRPLEVTRGELLSDRMSLHFFELRKLPAEIDPENMLHLWLSLFRAETEEAMKKIKAMEVPVMEQAISAYDRIARDPDFQELANQREIAAHNEASALRHARDQGRMQGQMQADKKWQGVVAMKETEIAGKDAEIERILAENAALKARLG
ncbi:MAG: Rpn family recombination-promoting nuclease/putative transposase, partial [Treponema sp.]|nr:Rpn family recombination-promoting nuclease/putative transposase [Treponema sp.]